MQRNIKQNPIFLINQSVSKNPLFSGQLNRTSGLYDLDGDGRKAVLIISSSDRKAVLVELKNQSISDTLWSYTLPKGTYFTDVSILDIDSNGQPDLVATSKIDMFISNGKSKTFIKSYLFKKGIADKVSSEIFAEFNEEDSKWSIK